MGFQALNLFMVLVFLLSAAVQYNDPDSLPWIVIYLLAAVTCLIPLPGYQKTCSALILAIALVWMIAIGLNIDGTVSIADIFASISMRTKEVEEAREIGGLAILCVWMVVLLKRPTQAAHT